MIKENPQSDKHPTDSVPVLINDVEYENASIDELVIAEELFTKAALELEEIIHRSEEPSKNELGETPIKLKIGEKLITVTFNTNRDKHLTVVDHLTSSTTKWIFSKVGDEVAKFLATSDLARGVASVLPMTMFVVLGFILLTLYKEINTIVVLVTIFSFFLSTYLSLRLLWFFSEARRFVIERNISKENTTIRYS